MKKKHIPTRMCVACREMYERQNLFRIVKHDSEIVLDQSYKMAGRGTYICKDENCIKLAFSKNMLKRALRFDVDLDFGNELLDRLYRLGSGHTEEKKKGGKVFRLKKDGSVERL